MNAQLNTNEAPTPPLSAGDEEMLLGKLAQRVADPTAYIEHLRRSPDVLERFRSFQNIYIAAFPADPWNDDLIDGLVRDIQASVARASHALSALLQAASFDSSTANAMAATWFERQERAEAQIAEYRAVIGASKVELPTHLLIALVEAPAGPWLAFYLAQNPDEAMRLAILPPHSAVRELGKLEALIVREPAHTLLEWRPEFGRRPS